MEQQQKSEKSIQIDPYKHIVKSQQFSKEFLSEVFKLTDYMKKNEYSVNEILKGKIIAMLFYEPSTRTRFSFEAACNRLGGSKITTENAKEFSSASKGETLYDSIKVINAYADFIVMRHHEDDASEKAIEVSTIPVINAGAGKAQHPTQALLDVYTINEHFKSLEGLKVAVVGDLLRGRTVDSLVYLMSKFPDNEFYFVSPKNSPAKKGIKDHLKENNVKFVETDDLKSCLKEVDVVYMTRVQKERFEDIKEYEKAKGNFILTKKDVEIMKENAIILHPLPRVDEIHPDVDNDPRAKYFQQAANGLYVRMALLSILNQHNRKL